MPINLAHKQLGIARMRLLDYKGAVASFERALEINPKDADLPRLVAEAKAKLAQGK